MIDSDFNSDSTSSSSVGPVNSPVVDSARELRTKSQNDCSTSRRNNEDEPALRASPLGAVVALGNALEMSVFGQYGTMVGLAERSPQLFPLGEALSSRLVGVAEHEAIAGPSRRPDEVSSVDSDEVDSVVRALESDGESTSLEAEEDEDPPEVISEEDEIGLVDLYMPPSEAGSAASV